MEESKDFKDNLIESAIEPLSLEPEIDATNAMRRLSPEDWHAGGEQLLRHAKEQGLPISCAFVDADSLKELNDTLGHHVGDEFLLAIDAAIRRTDLVGYGARVGGDEWKILSAINANDALVLKQRIQQSVGLFINRSGSDRFKTIDIGVSVGIATSAPEEQISLAELLRKADEDMYRDKDARALEVNWRKKIGIKVADMVLGAVGVTPSSYGKYKRKNR